MSLFYVDSWKPGHQSRSPMRRCVASNVVVLCILTRSGVSSIGKVSVPALVQARVFNTYQQNHCSLDMTPRNGVCIGRTWVSCLVGCLAPSSCHNQASNFGAEWHICSTTHVTWLELERFLRHSCHLSLLPSRDNPRLVHKSLSLRAMNRVSWFDLTVYGMLGIIFRQFPCQW